MDRRRSSKLWRESLMQVRVLLFTTDDPIAQLDSSVRLLSGRLGVRFPLGLQDFNTRIGLHPQKRPNWRGWSSENGRVVEWLITPVLKTGDLSKGPRVRIPLLPPKPQRNRAATGCCQGSGPRSFDRIVEFYKTLS